jgi:D-alanyl-D-alanine carboxypeptidase (penicillin-binding protein 5/6)
MNKSKIVLAAVGLMLFTSFAPLLSLTAHAEEGSGPNLAEHAKSAILIEQDTGTILFDKESHEQLPPASMTKIMTLLLIMEALDEGTLSREETVRVSENASSMGGSQIFLEAGEEMTVDDLLKGVAIASANDASVALAERISGSEEAFVEEMNKKAKELGLENTNFRNTTGLPEKDHYSSAYDMGMMARELLTYESVTDYTSIYEDYLRKGTDKEFWLVNTNKLVRFYDGVDGLKTGYTSEAKYCLAATAKRNDMRVVAVVLGYDNSKERNAAVSSMLDYAFSQFETMRIYEEGETITDVTMLKGDRKKTNIVTVSPVTAVHAKGKSFENLTTSYQLMEELTLPVEKGERVGTLFIKDGDEVILEAPLTVEHTIETASFFTLLKRSFQELSAFE